MQTEKVALGYRVVVAGYICIPTLEYLGIGRWGEGAKHRNTYDDVWITKDKKKRGLIQAPYVKKLLNFIVLYIRNFL